MHYLVGFAVLSCGIILIVFQAEVITLLCAWPWIYDGSAKLDFFNLALVLPSDEGFINLKICF